MLNTLLLPDCSWELVTNPTTGKEENTYVCKDDNKECKWVGVVNPETGSIEDKYVCK